jgi:F-type H+-transporting ATPase subunit b
MPQIAQLPEIWSSQLFWLLVIFGLVYFIVGKTMLPKVLDTVGLRDKQIGDDLAAAQAARDAADEQEDAWRKRENANRAAAHALVNEAKAKAAASTAQKLAAAQGTIDSRLSEAEQRIAAARAEAGSEIQSVAAEAAQDIVSRLAGITVDKAAASAAVKKAMVNG